LTGLFVAAVLPDEEEEEEEEEEKARDGAVVRCEGFLLEELDMRDLAGW
jgi:hypothetical protein